MQETILWNDVKKSLPNDDRTVLIFQDDGTVHVASCDGYGQRQWWGPGGDFGFESKRILFWADFPKGPVQ